MPGRRSLVDHGTLAALNFHKRNGEKPCEPCRLLRNAREQARKARGNTCPKGHKRVRQAGSKRLCRECYGFDPDKCGTPGGVGHHERYRVPMCDACRAVKRDRQRARRAKIARPPRKPKWLEEYLSLKSLAYTDKEIAKALGMSLEVLHGRLAEINT